MQVGVDVNRAVGSPWLAECLPFVAGLGPRKAAALLRALQRKRGADSRKAVWQAGVLGDRVFRCVAGSLALQLRFKRLLERWAERASAAWDAAAQAGLLLQELCCRTAHTCSTRAGH